MRMFLVLTKSLLILLLLSGALYAKPETRIVGGDFVSIEQFPFMAKVLIFDSNGGVGNCGGSIISSEAILSAAHCFIDANGLPKALDAVSVILGLTNWRDASENRDAIFNVTEIIVHPQYNVETNENDIAILRLSRSTNLPPITLPTQSTFLPQGTESVTVAGWGTTSEGGELSDRLKAVTLSAVPQSECFPFYNNLQESLMFCARGDINGGEDSCQGDSGGPIFAARDNEWIQAGIVSFGAGCARPQIPGVYTRVSTYADWIASFVPAIEPQYQGETTNPGPVTSDVPVNDSQSASDSVLKGEAHLYDVAGYSQITLITLSGDADLIVVEGSEFTDESVVCVSQEEGTLTDFCDVTDYRNEPELYAIVYGYEASSYEISVSQQSSNSSSGSGGSGAWSWPMLLATGMLTLIRKTRRNLREVQY